MLGDVGKMWTACGVACGIGSVVVAENTDFAAASFSR